MQARRRILLAASIVASATVVGIAAGTAPVARAALPTGFTDVLVSQPGSNPLSSPTDITALPDGRALILEKGGAVRVLLADGSLSATDAVLLDVCTGSEQGLLGAAPDPGFAQNGFVYLFYSRDAGNCNSSTGRFNRVSRFMMTGNSIDPASEAVLIDNMNIPAGNHNGGDLAVGHDGNLYVTVGDGGQGGTNPRGGPVAAARDLSLLNGKILRITTAGGVPADNPFVGRSGAISCAAAGIGAPTSATCTEIYAFGLRNPYRFAFDPNNPGTRFFINDVGESTWEEVDLGTAGADYGWNLREGPCAAGSSSNCTPQPGMTDPLTAYNHNIACSFITAGVFIPNGRWPVAYDGGYLFADGGCGKMWLRTTGGTVDYDNPFTTTSGVIVDVTFITNNLGTSLYYVTNSDGRVHQITFSGTTTTTTTTAPTTTTSTTTTTVRPSTTTSSTTTVRPTTTTVRPTTTTARPTTTASTTTTSPPTTTTTAPNPEPVPPPPAFSGVVPARLADTRPGQHTVDGRFEGGGAMAAGSTLRLQVAGRGGVAAGAGAASLNVTATGTQAPGFITVAPCDVALPTASNLNYPAAGTVANAVVTELDANGMACLYTLAATDLVVDVGGYFSAAAAITPITPARILETRPGLTTTDGQQQGIGRPTAGSTTEVPVRGRVGVAAGATAVVLNVTVTDASAPGYITVFPCGGAAPNASTVNYQAGTTLAGLAVSTIGNDGSVCFFTLADTHLVVDVTAALLPGAAFAPVLPARLLDTRPGFTTVDGQSSGIGTRDAGQVTAVQVTGRGGVPVGASAGAVNVAVTGPVGAGYVTVYACGTAPPLASNVNYVAGQTIASAAIVALGPAGTVCISTLQPTDLILDVTGAFT